MMLFEDQREIRFGPEINDRVVIYVTARCSKKLHAFAVDATIHCPHCEGAGDGCDWCKPYGQQVRLALLSTKGKREVVILRQALSITDEHFAAMEKIAREP